MKRKSFFLLAFIFIFFALSCVSPKSDLCFALFTDLHIASSGANVDALEKIVEDVNHQDSVAFVIVSGDVTEFGSDEEIRMAADLLAKITKPYYVVAGNHDAKWSESGCNTFERIFGYEHFMFQKNGYLFLGCNSGPNMRMAPALVPRESVLWLRAVLEQTPDDMPIVFVNHYPLNDEMSNYAEVVDLLNTKNIKLALAGHHHVNKTYQAPGFPGVICRSLVTNRQHPETGYTIISIKKGQAAFYERELGRTLPAWHRIDLNLPHRRPAQTAVSALDFSANELYPEVRTLWEIEDAWDIGSAPAADEKSGMAVYANTGGEVKAIALADASPCWTFATGGKVFSTPFIADSGVFVASTDSCVYRIDLFTGNVVWKFKAQKSIVASPTVWDGKVYIGGSDGCFRALDAATGKLVWEYHNIEGFIESRPFVDREQAVVGSWANELYSFDPCTGALQWIWSNAQRGRMYSPAAVWPVKANRRIYIATPERKSYAIDARTGKTLWEDSGGREAVGLSPDRSRFYVKTMFDSLYCFSTLVQRKKPLWRVKAGYDYEIGPSPVTTCDGNVYVPTAQGYIYAFKEKDGALLWKHRLSVALINYVLPLSDNRLLVSSLDGKVALLQL